MTTTVTTIVNAACRQLGFTPDAAEAADAMEALNLLLKEWATSPLGIYRVTRESFTMTAAKAEYTIGTGGELNTVRPIKLLSAFIRVSDSDSPILGYHVSEYAAIGNKASTGMPTVVYAEPAYPLGILIFHPVPDTAYALHLYSHKPMAEYTSLSSDLALPPEYEAAIKFNLAVEIAAEFGRALQPQTAIRAEQTLSNLKQLHSHPIPAINTDPFGATGFKSTIAQTIEEGTVRITFGTTGLTFA